jgi:putative component of toxin-antitoxin plasmid stabilization module
MTAVGPGVMEIRIHPGLEYRVFYVAKFTEGNLCTSRFPEANQENAER